jgi:hypothetical protein
MESGYATRSLCEQLLHEIYGMKKSCCRCEFFEAAEYVTVDGDTPSYEGYCRRYPPVPVEEGVTLPIVSESDWCGEFVEGKKLTVDDVYAYWLDDENCEQDATP